MKPSERRAPLLDPAFAGEILGSAVRIEHAGLHGRFVEGTLVDETMNTFVVRRPDGSSVRVGKTGARGTIVVGGRSLPLSGEALRHRPEDRTKRVAMHGRRS